MGNLKEMAVEENSLISVAIRADFAKENEEIYRDDKAIEIMNKLNRDFRKAKKNKKKVRDEMAKVILLDEMLSEFIKKHPDVNVVNIGCGLDTRYYRVDSEDLKWYNIDLEEVINERNNLLEEEKNNPKIKNIGISCTDEKWAEMVESKGSKTLFIIESLSMYLRSQEVSKMLKIISNNFKNPEVYIHVVHSSKVKNVREKRMYDEDIYIFGIKSGKELENISKLKYESEKSVIDVYKKIGFSTFLKSKSKSEKIVVLKS